LKVHLRFTWVFLEIPSDLPDGRILTQTPSD
jgi:hypothetical protein